MKNKAYITIITVSLCSLFLTGCNIETNPVSGFLYEEVGGSHVVTDQFDNKLIFTGDQVKQLLEMDEVRMKEFVTARFQAKFPESYSTGQSAVIVAEQKVPGEVVVSETAQTAVDALGYFPVWGDLASLVANGALAIGALWLGKKKKTAEKVNESLVKGIDVFRDVLDQTPQGDVIDAKLTELLKDRQAELNTLSEVHKLLTKFATPTKTALSIK